MVSVAADGYSFLLGKLRLLMVEEPIVVGDYLSRMLKQFM